MLVDTSSWATDSVLDMVHQSGVFKMTLDQQKLGPSFGPNFLNTSFIDTMLPGLAAKYGKD